MTDDLKVDRLSALLERFPPQIRPVFQGHLAPGEMCEHAPRAGGMLHLVGGAGIWLHGTGDAAVRVPSPSVLLLPRPDAHHLTADGPGSSPLFSATLHLGAADDNPLVRALPALLQVPLQEHPALESICALLWDEAGANRCAHGLLLARASEVLVIQLLRHAIAHRLIDPGLLSGLADARLMRVLAAVHAAPAAHWTLPRMAEVAHMSRARFAAHFVRVLGETPGEYVGRWRMGVARSLLTQGLTLKQVADETGYASASALTRAFAHRVGQPPSHWLAAHRTESGVSI